MGLLNIARISYLRFCWWRTEMNLAGYSGLVLNYSIRLRIDYGVQNILTVSFTRPL